MKKTIAGARTHTPSSKLDLDVGVGTFEIWGDQDKHGSRFVLRRTRPAATSVKRVKETRTVAKKTSKATMKIEAAMALLGGDQDQCKKILRAYFGAANKIDEAGLNKREVDKALNANGDPPLSYLVKLIAVRDDDEVEAWNKLKASI